MLPTYYVAYVLMIVGQRRNVYKGLQGLNEEALDRCPHIYRSSLRSANLWTHLSAPHSTPEDGPKMALLPVDANSSPSDHWFVWLDRQDKSIGPGGLAT